MTPSDDTFTRATSTVADFDSPFYAEERQRDVWNEASAIGLLILVAAFCLAHFSGRLSHAED